MKKRLTNIELLRILSMIMILELHLLVFSKTLSINNIVSVRAFFIWFIESLCFVAVNCYVLISGYFLVDSNFKTKKIIKIWLALLFYSVSIYIALLFLHKIDFKWDSLITCFFPFIFKKYWFCTMYIMLYILSPFLNKLIHSLNKAQYKYLIIIILVFFSLWSTFLTPEKTLNYGDGYGIGWFICLYFIAGYIKKYCDSLKIKKRIYFIVYLLLSLLNTIILLLIRKYSISTFPANFLYNYYSITVLIASISLFMFFKNLTIKNNIINKVISFLAPTTLGIYLIQEHSEIRYRLWEKFTFINDYPGKKLILFVIIIPISLFIIFSLIEKIRLIIFNFIEKLIEKINKKNNNIKFKCIEKLEDNLCQK